MQDLRWNREMRPQLSTPVSVFLQPANALSRWDMSHNEDLENALGKLNLSELQGDCVTAEEAAYYIGEGLDCRNRLQASQEVWTSAARTLRAVGDQRGWTKKKKRAGLGDIAFQLGRGKGMEMENLNYYMTVETLEQRVYEEAPHWDAIENARAAAEA